MNRHPASREKKALLISAISNFLIGGAALFAAVLSGSQAIQLDGIYNLIFCVMGVLSLKISGLVSQRADSRFPYGYSGFEPLINGIKGFIILGLTAMAVWSAIVAILNGGRPIVGGIAVYYASFASLICWIQYAISRRASGKTGSPLIEVDTENWMINAIISTGVLAALSMNLLIMGTRYAFLSDYVDPAIVLLISILTITVPIRQSWQSLMEILGRSSHPEIINHTRNIVSEALRDLPFEGMYLRLTDQGRTRFVIIHILLPGTYQPETISTLDDCRRRVLKHLLADHEQIFLEIIFTADREWAYLPN